MSKMSSKPFWWEKGREFDGQFSTLPPKTELAIVGGGYTGLAAAIAAAQKGAEVTVVDAEYPGYGASSRNGGMIGAPHRPGFVNELKTYGTELAHELFHEGQAAYEHTRERYRSGGIDAEYQQTGRIQLAFTLRHFNAMRERLDVINSIAPSNIRLIGREELPQHIRSDLYFGGLFYPDHGGINPRAALDGLLENALDLGVKICAESEVTGVRSAVGGFLLKTSRGEISARRLVMATNGYTRKAKRWLSRRIFPIPSYIIATEELPTETIKRVAPGGHMMVESRARHSYFRLSPDRKRILFGGRAALVSIPHDKAAKRLKQTMSEVWPEAKEWNLTHSWQGNTGFSFGMIPHVGEIDGIHFAQGYCGNGVALSPWLGKKVALRALGDPDGKTAFAHTRLESRPYHFGGRPWFMHLANPWWHHVVDRLETREARKDREALR